jgi:hypothetical protein
MTLDEFTETILIPTVLRQQGLPDTPAARRVLVAYALEKLAEDTNDRVD